VYVLFDAAGEPCYIGSTQNFRERARVHRTGIAYERWVAYPCTDREAAYELETRLLKEHKPYRNKKRGR
jgi:predicted GIY-YIG superfamily endonuclease